MRSIMMGILNGLEIWEELRQSSRHLSKGRDEDTAGLRSLLCRQSLPFPLM